MRHCKHCARAIEQHEGGRWVDPEATGDGSIWVETCDAHDTFVAEHEPYDIWLDTSIHEDDPQRAVYGIDTVGLVDDEQGGIVAYFHKDMALRMLAMYTSGKA